MDEFLRNSPRWMIVGGSLALALVLLLIFNPPYSACDSQFEVFKNSQTPFLYIDETKKFMTETEYQKSLQVCEERNLPGSCFQFFEGLRLMMRAIETVSYDCQPVILEKSEVKKVFLDSLTFIARLAWGVVPPQSYLDKTGWLDSVHLSTFCEIQSKVLEHLSADEWAQVREQSLQALPGVAQLDRKEAWNRSLISLKCP